MPRKNGFLAQKQHFWAQKGPFWAIEPKKRPAERPNGHLPENQRCSVKKSDFGANFGPKTCPCTPQELARHYDKHENIVFLVPSHDSSKKFGGCPQKMDFGPKNSTFGPKKAHFGQSGPKNGLPSGQTATYRKTKGIQSCLMIWGTYDPIESGPSDPKKWGLYGCSVKKCRFWPILSC